MKDEIYQIAEQIVQLNKTAYEAYLPLVENVCDRQASEDEVSHLLDYLVSFACSEEMLGLFKRVCRRYLPKYPDSIKTYIELYKEMWENEENDLKEYSE